MCVLLFAELKVCFNYYIYCKTLKVMLTISILSKLCSAQNLLEVKK